MTDVIVNLRHMLNSFKKLGCGLALISLLFSATIAVAGHSEKGGSKSKTQSFCGDAEIKIKNFRTVAFRGVAPQSHYECTDEFKSAERVVMRGGRLHENDISGAKELLRLRVKTILNLESESKADAEKELVEGVYASEQEGLPESSRIKLNYVNIVSSGTGAPELDHVQKIIAVENNTANYPLYIHCKRGIDRTGFAVALIRVLQGWPAKAAIEEWDSFRDFSSRTISRGVFGGGIPFIRSLSLRRPNDFIQMDETIGSP